MVDVSFEVRSRTPEPSLRERKKAASRATIEGAALALALEHGYENITVDMICEAAMVSPRTFFNYFGSKEGVILGAQPEMPTSEVVDEFVAGREHDVLSDFIGMVSETLAPDIDRNLQQARHELIQRNPELNTRRMALVSRLEDQYAEIIVARLLAEGRCAGDEHALEDEARMIIALAQGVMAYASRKWFTPGFVGTARELLADAVELVRRVVGAPAHSLHPSPAS